MDNFSQLEDQLELPPGFRFHPTDEELITHYLFNKARNSGFTAKAIGEVDMNKIEPWQMPWRAKMGEKEWYFFCVRDKKYPTGQRTNRATAAGYWKATGKDKEIFRGKSLVGMKKTLVFYKGRAPKGEKTNWVIHEYRLEGKASFHGHPNTTKNEWVICRVFHKSSGGKKIHISGLVRLNSIGDELGPPALPPLMESSPCRKPIISEPVHVPCFSNNNDTHTTEEDIMTFYNNYSNVVLSNSSGIFPRMNTWSYSALVQGNVQTSDVFNLQDQTMIAGLLGNGGLNIPQTSKTENPMINVCQETKLSAEINAEMSSMVVSNREMIGKTSHDVEHEAPLASVGPLDMDYFWDL